MYFRLSCSQNVQIHNFFFVPKVVTINTMGFIMELMGVTAIVVQINISVGYLERNSDKKINSIRRNPTQ